MVKRILRLLLVICAVLVVVLAGAAAFLYATFDPDDHRERVVNIVREKTGRNLRLDAPMSLSFFPWLGIRLEKVALENPPGFGEDPFATVDELDVRVRPLPLLDGQVVASTIKLDGLSLSLRRLEDGRDNWSDLVKTPAGDGPAGQTAPPSEADAWLQSYSVQGVDVANSAVSWRDETTGTHYRVDNVGIRTGQIEPGSAVPLDVGLSFQEGHDGVAGNLQLSGSLALGEDPGKVSIPDLNVVVDLQGASIPSSGLQVRVGGAVSYENDLGDFAIDELRLSGPGGVTVEGRLSGRTGEAPEVSGDLVLKPFNPRETLAGAGSPLPDTTDPSVLQRVSGQFGLQANNERVVIKPMAVRLDDTSIAGNVTVRLRPEPAIAFSLEADAIDVDRYLPPETPEPAMGGQAKKPEPGTAGGGADSAIRDLGGLATLTSSGSVAIGELKISGLTMNNTTVKISTGNGTVKLDPMTSRLYGGRYKGNVVLRSGAKAVKWKAVESLEGIRIGPLLRDLTGEDRLEGTGRLKVDMAGSGLSDKAVRQSAAGTVSFAFRDGMVKGVNLAQILREVQAALRGQRLESKGPLQTDFSSLAGTLKVGGGEVRNDDLLMKTPFLRVEGEGDAHLVREELDYLLTAKVVGSTKGQGGREFADLEGVSVPVKVRGSFDAPTFSPDIEGVVKTLAAKRLDEETEKLKEKAGGELQQKAVEELGKALKGIF